MELYLANNQPEKAELDSLYIKEVESKEKNKRDIAELRATCEKLKADGIIDYYHLPD
jgi:hypothetical protein